MGEQARLATWVPDRPPTWTEVVLATTFFALFGIDLVVDVLSGSVVSWPAVLAGVLVPVCFAVLHASFGTRLGQWYQHRHAVSRIVVAIATVSIFLSAPFWAPRAPFLTATRAFLTVYFVYVGAFVLGAREVSGWRPTQKTTD
jgi:hypothetical protein